MTTHSKSKIITGQGGPGRGQGRKPADGATGLKRRNISIDDNSADVLRDFGDGDLSLGIRRSADHIASRLPGIKKPA